MPRQPDDRALEQLSEFARAITHEMNNRLLAARFTVDLLRGRSGGADDKLAALDDCLAALDAAAADVYVIGMSAPALGHVRSLRATARDLFGELSNYAGQRDVELRCDPETLPDPDLDAAHVRMVLSALTLDCINRAQVADRAAWVELRGAGGAGAWAFELVTCAPGSEDAVAAIGDERQLRRGGAYIALRLAVAAADSLGADIEAAPRLGGGVVYRVSARQGMSR